MMPIGHRHRLACHDQTPFPREELERLDPKAHTGSTQTALAGGSGGRRYCESSARPGPEPLSVCLIIKTSLPFSL